TGTTVETVTYQVTASANGCVNPVTQSYTVTVYPIPVATFVSTTPTICSGQQTTHIQINAAVAGSTFTWTASASSANVHGFTTPGSGNTISDNLTNTGTTVETVTYQVTASANGCVNPVTQSYTVTVYPIPTVIFTSTTPMICSGQTTDINLSSPVAGSAFSWTSSVSNPALSGNSASSGNKIADILSNASAVQQTATYQVTPTANGCSNPVPATYSVTVNPVANVSCLASQTICSATATAPVALSSTTAGAVFSWTTAGDPGTSGFALNGSGNAIPSDTLFNSNTVQSIVTYTITASFSGCTGTNTTHKVYVSPLPVVTNNPLSQTICSGAASAPVTLTADVTPTTFSWTASSASPITGFATNGTSVIPAQTLVNNGVIPGFVDYHIIPVSQIGIACPGTPADYLINVNFLPTPSLTGLNSICVNNSTVYSTEAGMSNYTWNVSAAGSIISGGSVNDNTVTVLWNTAGSQTVSVNYNLSTGCTANTPTVLNITVKPRPVVTNAANSSICSGSAISIPLHADLAGTTFSWTATPSAATITGAFPGSGPVLTDTLANTGSTIETVTYSVTPSLNGCDGATSNFVVTIYPVAKVVFSPNGQNFCSGGATSIALASPVAGTAFSWTATPSSANVNGYSAGTGDTISQTLNNTSFNNETVSYQVSCTANGCTGTPNSVIVSVFPIPSVSFASCQDATTTTAAKPITLKGGTPLGGTYAGTGVNTGIFYPSLAGAGTFTITYSFLSANGCSSSALQTITVINAPSFFCNSTLTDIRDNKQYPTVQIGTQCWMSVNLNYGNVIASSAMQRDNCIPEKYCFNDNPANCSSIGGLYQWDELMRFSSVQGGQGLCPPGWHIPSQNDWQNLFTFYLGNGFAGDPLKTTGFSGFNALLSGMHFNNTSWNFDDFAVMYWTSTSHSPTKAWAHGLNEYNPSVSNYPSNRSNAFPVRCLKD
ncbi:MAG: PKD-like domain-containing protein, partial [Bacteroidota bacterium]|nr:PKD-like domain-containing protein [Bacteroidota bacterium]